MLETSARSPLVRSFLDRIANWLAQHGVPARRAPASASDLERLAAALGGDLPADLVAVLGFDRPLAILEAALIPPERWPQELAKSAGDDGDTFAARRWVPLADDGSGNLWVVDVSASPPVMRRWERAHPAAWSEGRSLPALFAHLALALESGQLTIDLAAGPRITSDTVIVFRTADLDRAGLDLVTPARLPPDAGPHGCLFFITGATQAGRMFAAVPERDIDHVDAGMAIAAEVVSKLEGLLDLAAFEGAASVGFHASPADDLERWLRAQDGTLVVPLTTLLVALDRPQLDDYFYGRFAFDRLVRGDAEIGLLPDVPAYVETMMAALWRAAVAGEPRAFAVLGECYFAVLVPCGAFDGVAPAPEDAPPFSDAAMQITDEELPPLSFALRCWYEAAMRGDRDALLRFATISRTGPERAKQLALELLTGLDAPTPTELDTTRMLANAGIPDPRAD